ncbi:DinB family protein [Candidatus Thorarchaeota archaeon]|nr:MAG: DinB family protein [Candidatus Thorarchaeota archaeon]
MDEQWKRQELVKIHLNMRTHLYRIIDSLTQEVLLKEISDEENYPHLLSLIWHIGGAETYWFHRANHDIAPKFSIESFEDIRRKLEQNTEGIKRVIETCSKDQLQIIPPSVEGGPSVAWCLLRTYQHGLYHTGQISKIRHIIDAPIIADTPDTWSPAVDAIIELLLELWNNH